MELETIVVLVWVIVTVLLIEKRNSSTMFILSIPYVVASLTINSMIDLGEFGSVFIIISFCVSAIVLIEGVLKKVI
jgi:hypothetical protein